MDLGERKSFLFFFIYTSLACVSGLVWISIATNSNTDTNKTHRHYYRKLSLGWWFHHNLVVKYNMLQNNRFQACTKAHKLSALLWSVIIIITKTVSVVLSVCLSLSLWGPLWLIKGGLSTVTNRMSAGSKVFHWFTEQQSALRAKKWAKRARACWFQ